MTIAGNTARVTFANANGGLEVRGDHLTGFTVCGPDRVFHNAQGTVEKDTVVLSAAEVPNPVALRYGWANFPKTNLFNRAGLPASPFRTDDFPLLKCPKCQSRGGDEVKAGICCKCNVRCGIYHERPFKIQPLENDKRD